MDLKGVFFSKRKCIQWKHWMNEWKLTKTRLGIQMLSYREREREREFANCTDALWKPQMANTSMRNGNHFFSVHSLLFSLCLSIFWLQSAAHFLRVFCVSLCDAKQNERDIIKTQLHKFITPYNFQLNTMHSHSITAIYQNTHIEATAAAAEAFSRNLFSLFVFTFFSIRATIKCFSAMDIGVHTECWCCLRECAFLSTISLFSSDVSFMSCVQ